jgi:glycosyltransferase involved in cell wall biosynthesis
MVSVIMPAYNEAEIIEASIRDWHETVVAKIDGAELIVVDDCSTDRTAEILQGLSGQLAGLRYLKLPVNGGHGKALRFGFGHVTQPWVFQTDSDRQHVPAEFWNLWNDRNEYDFVFGTRRSRADGTIRVAITTLMRICNLLVWQVWIRDANCPFKLMRAPALATLLEIVPRDSFIPMVMISILARKLRFRTKEVLVTHIARKGGTQSLKGLTRWVRVARQCTRELWTLRMTLSSRQTAR